MSDVMLKLTGIQKSFGGTHALHPTDLELAKGDILGLVGENGAGKSTLIKLLSGVYQPDAGRIECDGNVIRFASPREALDAGIATIHQELEYFGHLSVAENILLGETWPRYRWGGVNWKRLHEQAGVILGRFGIDIPTHALFEKLTAAQKQEVAIATALSRDARLLILDEPTASLSEPEVERLFAHLTRLRDEGMTIIYVSHRLDEIFRMTNRVAVLRDGQLVAHSKTSELDVDQLIQHMVGRPLDRVYPHARETAAVEPLLELKDVSRKGMFRDISLTVRAGEIVGLAGLVGAGRSELARAVYGLYSLDDGTMQLCGKPWAPRSARDALKAGLVYVPEERKKQGLVLDHSLAESVSIGFSDQMAKWGLVSRRDEAARVETILKQYDIRAERPDQPVNTLSGGNQQKGLLARWLDRDPRVIILDEPTRGVDIGAKAHIHAIIDRLAADGKAVLFISSELHEVIGMSDRVLVMDRGSLSAELQDDDITEQNIILAASGLYGSTTNTT